MKTILLAVCGLSPQVITETLFALHQTGRTVEAIHIITTQLGKERILSTLLEPGAGYYFLYLREYEQEIRSIDFGPPTIHTVCDAQGREIADIRDEADNEQLLRIGLDLSFRFTRNPDLYSKLAGNRPLEEMSDTGIVNLNADNFTMYKSKIRQDFQKSFGLYALKDLEIVSTGKRPNTRFGIGMDKGKIEIVY